MPNTPIHRRRARAFTIIELLVVITVITLLISLFLPVISQTRRVAADAVCSGNGRQALIAIGMYQGDFKLGLTNYNPACTWWGQGWPGGTYVNGNFDGTQSGVHASAVDINHFREEGESFRFQWRGYLMQGRYAGYRVLGCGAKSYAGLPFRASYAAQGTPTSFFAGYAGEADFPDETSPANASLRLRPAFVWYGPAAYDTYYVNNYALGASVFDANRPLGGMDSYDKRRILFTCPVVDQSYNATTGVFKFDIPHRSDWYNRAGDGVGAYAGNVGYSDGSVKFASNFNGSVNVSNYP